MPTRVLIDACILIPYQLSEFLLRLASAGMYEPVWSAEILDELHRNLIAKIGLSEEKADRRIARMQALFPYAAVDGYEAFQDLAESLGTDPKDRHVAAAALHGRVDVLITNNEKDFPVAALARYGVQVVKPDDFLRDQLELDPDLTIGVFEQQRASYVRPPITVPEFTRTLGVLVPGFITDMVALQQAAIDPNLPLPVEIADPQEWFDTTFPNGPQASEPLGAAFLWWWALLKGDQQKMLDQLTYDTWSAEQFEQARKTLRHSAIQPGVERSVHADDIVHVTFLPSFGHSAKAFATQVVTNFWCLTLTRHDDIWLVRILTTNRLPGLPELQEIRSS
ncbi:PIN domain-containing protein [Mycobacteroides abscessus]|uniref:PIN domain-containing protein n=1 Tax=Mycobacteroides abscessus TaxID=36809 RepID=UPI000925E11B|nr:PIN domain-containing protein [Mycobacteroides abscessus]SHV73630.1 toxin [Mycobacteroides abscessus subsp. abscessus]SHW32327.1 toxin [Mycobacteroides abscessus subsp. abscessus]SHW39901.1 toxin [Mycobacteroides abscessus subsp. abscessus]SHW67378.1 toxin [Mycobacteroides abscessus subsp. abscessus]SHX17342.1 toxin [Mycobacteroides abscessus subsp. abscessus]